MHNLAFFSSKLACLNAYFLYILMLLLSSNKPTYTQCCWGNYGTISHSIGKLCQRCHSPSFARHAVRPKLRWVLSLGVCCREYVRCVLATLFCVPSRANEPFWRLVRIEFGMQWPGLTRPASHQRSHGLWALARNNAFTRYRELFFHQRWKAERDSWQWILP